MGSRAVLAQGAATMCQQRVAETTNAHFSQFWRLGVPGAFLRVCFLPAVPFTSQKQNSGLSLFFHL